MDSIVILVVWLALMLVVGLLVLVFYNGLARGRMGVREGWSAVQVQLRRRAELIPNLVETVKGYAAHEREVLENVTRSRAQLQTATTPHDASAANNMLTQALRSLFAVAEAYPQLKADANFRELQEQLTDTEDKIAYARNYYNSLVLQYNVRVTTIPSMLVAKLFGFDEAEFFEEGQEGANNVVVKFP